MNARPLASWRTWWDKDLATKIAATLKQHVDPKKLPGRGTLLSGRHLTAEILKETHVASVAEALLIAYPLERQPSGYLLGDSVLQLDKMWNGGLLGGPSDNPMTESVRRENALAEGGKLKKLLSYVRTSGLKNQNGKTEEISYLKSLANKRSAGIRRQSSASTASTASTTADSPGSSDSSDDTLRLDFW